MKTYIPCSIKITEDPQVFEISIQKDFDNKNNFKMKVLKSLIKYDLNNVPHIKFDIFEFEGKYAKVTFGEHSFYILKDFLVKDLNKEHANI